MAQRLNHHFGDCLRLPRAVVQESVQTIVGTDGRKMSKSYDNTIPVFLPPKKLRKAVMGVTTDSKGLEDVKDPATCNVFALYRLFASSEQQAQLAAKYRAGNFGYGHAKQELYEVLEDHLGPARERYSALRADESGLEDILQTGAERARVVGRGVLERVRQAVGFTGKRA